MNTPFGSSDETVIIPAATLTGTRDEKLGQLDAFLVQLHVVRRALASDTAVVSRVVPADRSRPGSLVSHGWRRIGAAVLVWAGRAGIGTIGIRQSN